VFQLVVFFIVLAILFWLANNYLTRSQDLGIPTSFDFLDQPTSFDITGADFSPAEPVRNAYLVGIGNTIRISAVGIVFATALGILVGIGRLSRNWVVSKLATVYVESLRNVPLLVIMTFCFLGIVLQLFPRIEDAWNIGGLIIVSNRGVSLVWFEGTTLAPLLGFFLLGLVGWWLIARWRRRVFERTGAPTRAGLLGLSFLILVMVTGWFVLGATITTPEVADRAVAGGIRVDPSYFAVLFALVIYTASHIAEITRGSIQAVPKGQGEAGSALALSGFQRLWFVVLPQAMRIAIPPIGNQYLNLIKNSSLGAAFAYFDLTLVAQITVGNGKPAVPAFVLALVFYVVLSLITSTLVNIANRYFKLVER
jgi:general L-amino acid transport system permease protein